MDKLFCELCNGPRPERKSKPERPPPPSICSEKTSQFAAKLQRQTSTNVETIREDDEEKAIKEWNDLISVCRNVCSIQLSLLSFIYAKVLLFTLVLKS